MTCKFRVRKDRQAEAELPTVPASQKRPSSASCMRDRGIMYVEERAKNSE